MRWDRRIALAIAVGVCAACGRVGFDDGVPGLADGVRGVPVSEPGAIVIEDGRYDVATSVDGAGYAVVWTEFPAGGRTEQVMFASFSEAGDRLTGPVVVEIVPGPVQGLRLTSGSDGYLVIYELIGGSIYLALDPGGAVRARRQSGLTYDGLSVVPTSTGYLLAFGDGYDMWTDALDRDGNDVTGIVPIEADPTQQDMPTLGAIGDQVIMAWTDYRTGVPRIRTAPVNLDGTLAAPSTQVYETGDYQGNPYVIPDGAGGYVLAHDGLDHFPEVAIRISADGVPLWPTAVTIYDERRHHDTLSVAGARDGRGAFVWITEDDTLLTNVYASVLAGDTPTTPPSPTAALITDPTYSFCYPETARATASFGTVFAGEVEGSLRLFLVIVPD